MSTEQIKAFNVYPYFDDFDSKKGFHQIMFKPSVAVQSRELTQLQTILRDQIKKFGDHIFQHGSLVIPGNSFYDVTANYVKLDSTYMGNVINVSLFEDGIVVGVDSGVEAVVRSSTKLDGTDPDTIYVHYIKAGANGESSFNEGEEIYLKENISVRAIIGTDPFGFSTMAFVNDGVYYVNGAFVHVEKQSVVVDKYSASTSAHVLLQIIETIVTPDDDQSLLDPAQGEPNYAAPGADRLRYELKLISLPVGSELTDDYIELMRIEEGELSYHAKTPKYSELEKSLAERTYDESGDYLVNGFEPKFIEHIKLPKSIGLYPPPVGNTNKFVLQLTPGKAYIRGFGKEKINKTNLVLDKARTADHIKNKSSASIVGFGQIVFLKDLVKLPNTYQHQEVEFYDTSEPVGGTKVGSAKAYMLENKVGFDIYSLYIYDTELTGSYAYKDVGSIRFGVDGSAKVLQKLSIPNSNKPFEVDEVITSGSKSATVVYHSISDSSLYISKTSSATVTPDVADVIIGANSTAEASVRSKTIVQPRGIGSSPIIPIPMAPLASVKDATGQSDIVYRVSKYLTIDTDIDGNGSVNVDVGRIDSVTSSNVIASWSGGSVSLNLFDLSADGTTLLIENGPSNATIYIQATVSKVGVQEKTKTLNTTVDSGLSLTGTTVKSATLTMADGVELISVISSIDGDVTNKFKFDGGQRNYFYGPSKIILNTSEEPAGTLEVTYQYFQHSLSGDYFTVDSYRGSGIANPTDLDFVNYVPSYYSTIDSTIYNLAECYDFRKILGAQGDAPVNESRIVSSVDYYVGRIDMYGVNISGEVVYLRGIPEEIPEQPIIPEDTLILGSFVVPAWTGNIRRINISESKVKRFTMKDINDLATRVSNVEDYVTLTALESDTARMNIVDPVTGLNRYKMGFIVDDFSSTGPSDFYNPHFAAEIENGVLTPAKEWVESSLAFEEGKSLHYRRTGDVITLPYTEEVFINQPFSTKITNVNPFMVIAWIGQMSLNPSFDSWVETEDLPNITRTTTRVIQVTQPPPAIPPRPPIIDSPPAVGAFSPGPAPPRPVPAPTPAPVPVPETVVAPAPVVVTPPPPPPPPAPPPPPKKVFTFWDSEQGGAGYWDPSELKTGEPTQGPDSWF